MFQLRRFPGSELDVRRYHAAPTTDRRYRRPHLVDPHEYGLVSVKNFPGENCSPASVNNMSRYMLEVQADEIHRPTTVRKEAPPPRGVFQ
jgi:hypothetical protein